MFNVRKRREQKKKLSYLKKFNIDAKGVNPMPPAMQILIEYLSTSSKQLLYGPSIKILEIYFSDIKIINYHTNDRKDIHLI